MYSWELMPKIEAWETLAKDRPHVSIFREDILNLGIYVRALQSHEIELEREVRNLRSNLLNARKIAINPGLEIP